MSSKRKSVYGFPNLADVDPAEAPKLLRQIELLLHKFNDYFIFLILFTFLLHFYPNFVFIHFYFIYLC